MNTELATGARLNATLLIDGHALPDDIELSVWVCRICGGTGRRLVVTGAWIGAGGRSEVYRQEHPCGHCRQSGLVMSLSRRAVALSPTEADDDD